MNVTDGAVLVQMLPPVVVGTTFQKYAEDIFAPYIKVELESLEIIDIVWDVYNGNCLKMGTCEKQERAVCRTVIPSVKVLYN